MRELLFSVTKKDLTIQVFRAGGKGGQKQNKTSSGVRVIHSDSGARGESREERSQSANKKKAFKRMVATGKFKLWLNAKAHEMMGNLGLEADVEKEVSEDNLLIEVRKFGERVKE